MKQYIFVTKDKKIVSVLYQMNNINTIPMVTGKRNVKAKLASLQQASNKQLKLVELTADLRHRIQTQYTAQFAEYISFDNRSEVRLVFPLPLVAKVTKTPPQWKQDEKEVQQALGQQATPNSGGTRNLRKKGDGIGKYSVSEVKTTGNKSYTLHEADLVKNHINGVSHDKTPVFVVSFPNTKWAIVSFEIFSKMQATIEGKKSDKLFDLGD